MHVGDPNCLVIASIPVRRGENYTVVVSDQDSFEAVLPMRTVKYLYVSTPRPLLPSMKKSRCCLLNTDHNMHVSGRRSMHAGFKALMQLSCCMTATGRLSIGCLEVCCVCLLQLDNTAATAVGPAVQPGPVTGPPAPAAVAKAESIKLPANALLPAVSGPVVAPLASMASRPEKSGSALVPSPSAFPFRRAQALSRSPQPVRGPAAAPFAARGV